jgi:NAD+ diphosphatase
VEAGETLEHAVSREVFEESGILVRNITYFSSQPWPFPSSLMIAFTAEYAGGELTPEPGEIDDLDWYTPDTLPDEIPSTYSIARRLIEWFVSEYGTENDLQRLLERL